MCVACSGLGVARGVPVLWLEAAGERRCQRCGSTTRKSRKSCSAEASGVCWYRHCSVTGMSRLVRPAPYRSHSKPPAEVHGEATIKPSAVRSVSTPGLQRGPTSTSVIDVLDHILDKGIVIDAWVRVSVIGIDLITMEARVVVASIETYLNRAEDVAQVVPACTTVSRQKALQRPPTRSPGWRGPMSTDPPTRKH